MDVRLLTSGEPDHYAERVLNGATSDILAPMHY
jgi:hypothetical protein